MPSIDFNGALYTVGEGESVLDALLRNGVKAAHSCKAGSCGSCLLRATEGVIPDRAQTGLKDSWKAQGYFYPAFVCRRPTHRSNGRSGRPTWRNHHNSFRPAEP